MQRNSRLQELVPKLVLAPSFLIVLVFVYGFIIYTGVLSVTNSRMLPSYGFVGLSNYEKLWALPHWWRAVTNLAIFASLYIIICSVIGLFWQSCSIRRSVEKAFCVRSTFIPWRFPSL